jgi:hypothetical protein
VFHIAFAAIIEFAERQRERDGFAEKFDTNGLHMFPFVYLFRAWRIASVRPVRVGAMRYQWNDV